MKQIPVMLFFCLVGSCSLSAMTSNIRDLIVINSTKNATVRVVYRCPDPGFSGSYVWKAKQTALQPKEKESISVGEKKEFATIGLAIVQDNQEILKRRLKLKREETIIHVEKVQAIYIEGNSGMLRIVD